MKTDLIKQAVFEFKRELYLKLLLQNNFNIFKTARNYGINRNDLYNHVGTNKKNIIKLAKEYLR